MLRWSKDQSDSSTPNHFLGPALTPSVLGIQSCLSSLGSWGPFEHVGRVVSGGLIVVPTTPTLGRDGLRPVHPPRRCTQTSSFSCSLH